MSSDNQSKYGANRNLWRKHYPIGSPRREPQTVSLVDTDTDTSYSLNLQTTIRHRDYYKIIQFVTNSITVVTASPIVLGEYDEGLIYFDNSETELFYFNFIFSGIPYVVFTIEDSTPSGLNQQNINVFGTDKNNQYGFVAVSAPFSGTVRYRAALAPSYPAYFTSSFTGSIITASAGAAGVVWATEYTASFGALPGAPSEFRSSPFNTLDTSLNDVYLDPDETTFAAGAANGTISAPFSGTIEFIAYA